MMNLRESRGQMLLVVVLTMIVALTVGLSIASRTITDLRISRQNEESQRAFQAAEAGIERALQSAEEVSDVPFANNSEYSTIISNPSGTNFLLNAGELVDQNTGIDLWLSDYPDYSNPRDTNLTVYWSRTGSQTECDADSGDSTIAALEVVILSGSLSNPVVTKYVSDGCALRTSGATSAAGGTMPITNMEFNSALVINGIVDGLVARVIPLYNSTVVGVVSSADLPEQGTVVESTGISGQTVRRVQYFASHPQIPLEIFPYSLVAQ